MYGLLLIRTTIWCWVASTCLAVIDKAISPKIAGGLFHAGWV